MLLAIDIGNSSIKFGIFDGERLVSRFFAPTDTVRREKVLPAETIRTISEYNVDAVIVSSVVPEVNAVFAQLGRAVSGVEATFLDRSFDFGIRVSYETPETLGIDRLVAASAAAAKYATPCIVCDFGTATTIDAVGPGGEYMGGTITPGVYTLSRSLFQNTSNLPEIEIKKPSSVIGKSTAGSIESGVFYGYIGLVEGILSRMKVELESDAQVIATGGYVRLIAENTRIIDVVDESLMLEGLCRIYSKINDF
jgi:type III pantothenate kinase